MIRAIRVLSALAFFLQISESLDAIAPQLNVVPYPSSVQLGNGALWLNTAAFDMLVAECHADCDIIHRAVDRYLKIITLSPGSTGTTFRLSIFENRINQSMPVGPAGQLNRLKIAVTNKVLSIFSTCNISCSRFSMNYSFAEPK